MIKQINSVNTQPKKSPNRKGLSFVQYLKYYINLLKGSVRILREVLYKILLLYFKNEKVKAQI